MIRKTEQGYKPIQIGDSPDRLSQKAQWQYEQDFNAEEVNTKQKQKTDFCWVIKFFGNFFGNSANNLN